MSKTILVAVALAFAGGVSVAKDSHSVKGYVKKDGTYVAPHVKTSPNETKIDNYSTKGNTNPYTGKEGSVDPYKLPEPSKKK